MASKRRHRGASARLGGLAATGSHQDPVIDVRDEEVEPVRLALVLVEPEPPDRTVGAGLRGVQVVEDTNREQAQQRQLHLAAHRGLAGWLCTAAGQRALSELLASTGPGLLRAFFSTQPRRRCR